MGKDKEAGQHAVELFDASYNCAEAVLMALAAAWDLDIPFTAGTAFGGGVARSGQTCGALSGALVALGVRYGRRPHDDRGRDRVYQLAGELMQSFRETHGDTGCLQLTGCLLAVAEDRRRFNEQGIRQRVCRALVRYAADEAGAVWQRHQDGDSGSC